MINDLKIINVHIGHVSEKEEEVGLTQGKKQVKLMMRKFVRMQRNNNNLEKTMLGITLYVCHMVSVIEPQHRRNIKDLNTYITLKTKCL